MQAVVPICTSRILHLLRTLLAAHGARTRAAHHEHDPVEHDKERPARHEQRIRIAGRADSVGAVGGAPGLGGDGGVGERHGERDAEPEHREARRHERALVAEALRGGGERDEEQEGFIFSEKAAVAAEDILRCGCTALLES